MHKVNSFLGIGFGFDLLTAEEGRATPCMFHKLGDEEPHPCDNPTRLEIKFTEGDAHYMCAEHFELFATDMVDALSVFADAASLDTEPEVILNTKDKSACTRSAFNEIFLSAKARLANRH